jgi:hypothetical protein
MAPYNYRNSNQGLASIWHRLQPGMLFIVMIFGALISFEIFNFSTTEHALNDLLGDITFVGIPWSMVLALAFCGIDFAGIARLFTPEQGMEEPKEVWYLFGAWLLAATMNAILTWWGVSMAVANHTVQSSTVIDPKTISGIVPVFVAVLVWLIRILIIGTLSLSMDRLLHPGVEQRIPLQNAVSSYANAPRPQAARPAMPVQQPMNAPASLNSGGMQHRPAMSRSAAPQQRSSRNVEMLPDEYESSQPVRPARPEPTYHSLSMNARPAVTRPNPTSDNGNGNGNGNSGGENNNNNYRRRN